MNHAPKKADSSFIGWLTRASLVNEETDNIDKSTSTLMFMCGWVLASACACHYFSQFQTTGHVQGDEWCCGAYVMSIALYKPIQLPMLQCVIKLLSVRLEGNDRKAKKQIRTAFSLFGGLSTEVLASWKFGTPIWLISFWYMIPTVMVLPLMVIFAPATLPLLLFMLAPCVAMYIATAADAENDGDTQADERSRCPKESAPEGVDEQGPGGFTAVPALVCTTTSTATAMSDGSRTGLCEHG